VTFTAATGVTYGIGVFVSGATDTGAYTLILDGTLSAPVQSTPNAGTGSLSGVVYNDANSDGLQDDGETGISGVTVYIDMNGTGQFAAGDPTATTDANGTYTFTGLSAGTYTVLVESANGYTQTSPANSGGVSGTVAAGQDTTVAAIGEVQQGGGGISGTVYNDANDDGNDDAGDAGLAGWYVYIDVGNNGEYVDGDPYAQTDANGNYSFSGLAPGSYTLRVYPQSGYTTTQGSNGLTATVTANQSATGGNFGEAPAQASGSISGVVYNDLNDDYTQDSGDPGLAGWQVYIDLGNTGSYSTGDPTAYTDSSGTYSFTGIAAGTYTIGVVGQSGYTTTEGSEEWTVSVGTGEAVNGGSFGESQATGGLWGTVYNVANNYGIDNWAVYIDLNDSGQYVTGDPYYVTGTNGGYSFTDLAPGTYVIRAAVYTDLAWNAVVGADGYTVTVVANQNSFGGNFGEEI
jgi:protocatechuate 3,4-dioxygenase beta subunit